MDSSTSNPQSFLEPNCCSSSDNTIQIEDVESFSLTGHSQSDLNKVGQYLSKHKMDLLEKSNFSLQQVFELLESQSVYKNIDSVIESLDSGSEILVDQNTQSSSQSSSLDFNVQTSTETHIEHVSEVDRGLPSVDDNPNANISPDPCTPVSNSDDVYSDTTPVSDSSQSFNSEMFLLFQYLAELEKMAKAKIKVDHIRTVKNFALKVHKFHMDFVFEYIEMQKVISTKNDEIIALQKRVIDQNSSSSNPDIFQSEKLDSLKKCVDQLLPKIDTFISTSCQTVDISDSRCPDEHASNSCSDQKFQNIDLKIDEIRNSINQLPPKIVSLSSNRPPTISAASGGTPSDPQDDTPARNSTFDPNTHDWDNGEWVDIVKKSKGRDRSSPKPLSYNDILRKPLKELDIPKVSMGVSNRKGPASCILLLEPELKSVKMSTTRFLSVKSKIKALVNKENRKILIDTISPTKSGGVLLSFPSTKDLESTKIILSNYSSELKLSPIQPNKILPKVEISNIDGAIPQNQIVNVLLEKNPEIRSKINSEKAIFDLVFSKKDFYSNTQTAVFKCSPCIRSLLLETGSVVIDCDRCPCKDHFFVFQCFHCASLGHSSSRCPRKNNSNLRCFFCAAKGDHDSDHCPSKLNPDKHACCNCMSSTDLDIRTEAITHSANSKQCPLYLREISKLALRTDFGDNFVY